MGLPGGKKKTNDSRNMSVFSVDHVQLKKTDEKERKCLPWGSEEGKVLASKASQCAYWEDNGLFPWVVQTWLRPVGLENRERTDTFGEIVSKYCVPFLFFFYSSPLLTSLPPFFLLFHPCSLLLCPRLLKVFPQDTPMVKWTPRGPSALPTTKVKSLRFIFLKIRWIFFSTPHSF